jgi:hypothetical protein
MIRCPESERLTNLLADLVNENAELSRECHMALQARDKAKVEEIRAGY